MDLHTPPSPVTDAMYWLIRHREDQPSLDQLATVMGMSPGHAQRTFQQAMGVSPKQFLRFLTREAALERLAAGATALETAFDTGLSGPGRLHDLLVTTAAVTPGEARRRGAGLEIEFGTGATPLGPALLAWTRHGIAWLGLTRETGTAAARDALRETWPAARLRRDDPAAATRLARIFAGAGPEPTRLWLHGSPFQLKVWEALLAIPPGCCLTYGQLARRIGRPGAARAVGAAVGRNPVAVLVPCHRVIGETGRLTGYRWGLETKQALLGLESVAATA